MIDYKKYIKNALSLRTPQEQALDIFDTILNALTLEKNVNLEAEFAKINALYPTLTSFERDFPSFTFALATGIGKTRLMGAMIAYLVYTKNIKNFFVLAPNLTIYNKLLDDFGNPADKKYVFKGLDKFVDAPNIINGDNYENFRGKHLFSEININVFNISKFNSDTKTDKNKPTARIKRLNEVLGESYFEYLKNLDDLCIFMDESHHYHADKAFAVINELKPVLGVEVTATPQIQSGSKAIPFKNVVYEYSLAHALNDKKYVKVPVVVTRKDFKPEQYSTEELDREKLNDGIKMHTMAQDKLYMYSLNYNQKLVKPFMLVVAKDTTHSKQIESYLTSNDFYLGKYKNKVLEINSSQKGSEKDENIEKLLKLEDPNNEVEIVIHVNMLKEGWDVTNLYTIVPLRASASETLTEQTLGRGLRLPYGQRTGIEEIDRLSVVSHDKYEAIVNLAKDENSLVRKVYTIEQEEEDINEGEKVIIEVPSSFEEKMQSTVLTDFTSLVPDFFAESDVEQKKQEEAKVEVVQFIVQKTVELVNDSFKHTNNIKEVKSGTVHEMIKKIVVSDTHSAFSGYKIEPDMILECAEKIIHYATEQLTEKTIPIPQTTIQPSSNIKIVYEKFTVNMQGIQYNPKDERLIGTELQEGGETFDIDATYAGITPNEKPENAIAKFIIAQDDIDYSKASEVIFDCIEQVKKYLFSYLKNEDDVIKVLQDYRNSIAEIIYKQITKNMQKVERVLTASNMLPFSKIEKWHTSKFEVDKTYHFNDVVPANEVKSKVFTGFKKSCHSLYKFDSNTEKVFSQILEVDNDVIRWMRPAPRQFNLYYGENHKYEPDFVVETEDTIYIAETKASNMVKHEDVIAKAKTAQKYCEKATKYNLQNGGKAWKFVLIASDDVRVNSSFKGLVNSSVKPVNGELF